MRSARFTGTTILWLILGLAPLRAGAQGTLDDYRRAANVNQRLTGLTIDVAQAPTWIGPTRFWYRKSVSGGNQFMLVDAQTAEKRAPFDHARLATALTSAASPRTAYTATTLPFVEFALVNNDSAVDVDANGSRWRCTLGDYSCTRVGLAAAPDVTPGFGGGGRGGAGGAGATAARSPSTACVSPDVPAGGRGFGRGAGGGGGGGGGAGAAQAAGSCISPDGRTEAFIQNHNVATRPARESSAGAGGRAGRGGRGAANPAAGAPSFTLLSFDGSEGDAYQLMSIRWSPDSKKLVAYRRRPGYNRLVHYVLTSPVDQLQPKDTTILYRKPGDLLDAIQPVLFDVEARTQRAIDNALFPTAYQISQAVWRQDSHAFTFEYNQRGHQVYRVIEVDASSGAARAVVSDEPKTFFSYRPLNGNASDHGSNYRFDVNDGKEVVWMSERTSRWRPALAASRGTCSASWRTAWGSRKSCSTPWARCSTTSSTV